MLSILSHIADNLTGDALGRSGELEKRLIARRDIDRMLDIGCNDGMLTIETAEIAGAHEIHGIESSESRRIEAEKRGITCASHFPSEYDNGFFDLIVSSRTLGSTSDVRAYLEECHRCLAVGGQIIIITRNGASWANIGALLLGWQPFSTSDFDGFTAGNPIAGFLRDSHMTEQEGNTVAGNDHGSLSPLGIRDLMEKVGFRNIKTYTRGWLPLWGFVSDLLCWFDRRHGHILIASGFKKADIWNQPFSRKDVS